MQCPVAGFQFHAGESCWARLKKRDALVLRREPGNRHDPRAICVEWQGVRLGYVPREANYAVSQMIDRGSRVEARISELRQGPDPWQRIMMDVVAYPPPAPAARAPVLPPVHVRSLSPCVVTDGLPALRLGLANPPKGAERERLVRILEDVVREFARRLELPPHCVRKDGRRCVRLWEAVEVSVDADGRDMRARYLEPSRGMGPLQATLDLRRPIGPGWLVEPLVQVLADACRRQGMTRIDRAWPAAGWLRSSLRLTFMEHVDYAALRRSVLEFLAPEPLARSLANRVFRDASIAEFNWVCGRAPKVALIAVEHPSMLQFLRLAFEDEQARTAPEPLQEVKRIVLACGLEPAAWKKLGRWTFEPFESIQELPACHAVAGYGNLLHRLGVQSPPSDLANVVAAAAGVIGDPPCLDFERLPDWFLRALFRAADLASCQEDAIRLRGELLPALDWIERCHPEADANQQRAGWAWIVAQARGHAAERAKARLVPWDVPLDEIRIGDHCVVPITCGAELAKEAEAMKNCLVDYEDDCARGEMLVFSIRDALTRKRLACLSTVKDLEMDEWVLQQVAGKLNATVGPELQRVAELVAAQLRRVTHVSADWAPQS